MACYATPSPLAPPPPMSMLITPPTSPHRLPSIDHFDLPSPVPDDSVIGIKQVDWIGASHPNSRSSHLVASKFCEMICYLWFSPSRRQPYPSPENSPYVPPAPSPLQMTCTPDFVRFVQKLLETTQVSQSVIVLSLHYIYKLKERNKYTVGQSGSEYRIAVVALMMANKFLDDNTYTNKTWSEVSKISLTQINTMESEFLAGVEFKLYVDKAVYESWTCLLSGLVRAQERDSGRQHARRKHHQTPRRVRARSISPVRAPVQVPSRISSYALPPIQQLAKHSPSKRTAAEAFSPSVHPAKRPLIAVQIPVYSAPRYSNHSPVDLPSFGKMSIASANSSPYWPTPASSSSSVSSISTPPKGTLVTAYDYSCPNQTINQNQNLYFYALAGSPERKGRLRYCQPVSYAALPVASSVDTTRRHSEDVRMVYPMDMHSARTSPAGALRYYTPSLPPIQYLEQQLPPIHYFDQPIGVREGVYANAGPPGVRGRGLY